MARRKLGLDWGQVEESLRAIRILARAVHALDLETHTDALVLAQRYALSFYDAVIVAAAIRARCTILYTGAMQDSLEIDEGLRIVNPFEGGERQPR